jgi:hypothetical protein
MFQPLLPIAPHHLLSISNFTVYFHGSYSSIPLVSFVKRENGGVVGEDKGLRGGEPLIHSGLNRSSVGWFFMHLNFQNRIRA